MVASLATGRIRGRHVRKIGKLSFQKLGIFVAIANAWIEVEARGANSNTVPGEDFGTPPPIYRHLALLPDRTRLKHGWVFGLQGWARGRGIAVEFISDALHVAVTTDRAGVLDFVRVACEQAVVDSLSIELDSEDEQGMCFRIRAEEF